MGYCHRGLFCAAGSASGFASSGALRTAGGTGGTTGFLAGLTFRFAEGAFFGTG